MKILLVEDDIEIANFIKKGLQEFSFNVEYVTNGEKGLEMALNEEFSLLIIDIMLPGKIDGLELIKEIRKKDKKIPIIILSAKRSVQDKVNGLLKGSDDYLTKPFNIEELYARILALLRRVNFNENTSDLTCNDLKLDLLSRSVYRSGKKIFLKPKEFALLEYLLRNKGRVVTRTMILNSIWDFNFDPQTNVVDVLIHRLRSKIDKGFSKQLIKTIRGVGYIIDCTEKN